MQWTDYSNINGRIKPINTPYFISGFVTASFDCCGDASLIQDVEMVYPLHGSLQQTPLKYSTTTKTTAHISIL
jgi:hypothetical protein